MIEALKAAEAALNLAVCSASCGADVLRECQTALTQVRAALAQEPVEAAFDETGRAPTREDYVNLLGRAMEWRGAAQIDEKWRAARLARRRFRDHMTRTCLRLADNDESKAAVLRRKLETEIAEQADLYLEAMR